MISSKNRTRFEEFCLILILGALDTVTPFSIDLYLPSFPQIAEALNTTVSRVSFSVASYFVGYALGQVGYGPLLDRFGRKKPLYCGLVLYIAASLGCILSSSVELLIASRALQALGGCVAGVASVAMVRDFFPVEKGAKIFSLLMLILGVSPLLAPTVGGILVSAWGWKSIFIVLAGSGFLLLLVTIFFLPEGHTPDRSVSLKPLPILKGFKSIFQNEQFFTYALAGSFSFGGLFVYVTGSPSIFMDGFQLSAKAYGYIFALLSVGFIGGGQINLLLTKKFKSEKIFKAAVIVQSISGTFFLIGVLQSWCGLYSTIAFLFILLSCSGLTYPNAAALALAPFSTNAGSASALLGFIQVGLGALLSSSVGILNIKGSLPTALSMVTSSLIALVILMRNQMKR